MLRCLFSNGFKVFKVRKPDRLSCQIRGRSEDEGGGKVPETRPRVHHRGLEVRRGRREGQRVVRQVPLHLGHRSSLERPSQLALHQNRLRRGSRPKIGKRDVVDAVVRQGQGGGSQHPAGSRKSGKGPGGAIRNGEDQETAAGPSIFQSFARSFEQGGAWQNPDGETRTVHERIGKVSEPFDRRQVGDGERGVRRRYRSVESQKGPQRNGGVAGPQAGVVFRP